MNYQLGVSTCKLCCHGCCKRKIEELLVKLLKLESSERMKFQEFFVFVNGLIKSKLTVQDGVMYKTEFDKQLTYVNDTYMCSRTQ